MGEEWPANHGSSWSILKPYLSNDSTCNYVSLNYYHVTFLGTCLGTGLNSNGAGQHTLMTVVAPSSNCQYHIETPHNVNLYQVMMTGGHNFPEHFRLV